MGLLASMLALLMLFQSLPPPAAKIKAQVDQLPVGGRVTVEMLNGREFYGNIHSIEPESFSIREVDLKQVITIRYDEVKKILNDYGRKGFGGRRVHPRRARIVTLVVLGVLLTIVFVAVASDKS
jgi:hypothetical protein